MSEQTDQCVKHLKSAAKRAHTAAVRVLSAGKPSIPLPLSDGFAGGIGQLVLAGAMRYFSPFILKVRPETIPVDFVTEDFLSWLHGGVLVVCVLLAATGLRHIAANPPRRAVVDEEANLLAVRGWWGKTKAISLSDCDGVKLVRHDGSASPLVSYVLVFKKRLLLPAMPLSRPFQPKEESEWSGTENLRPLARALAALPSEPAPKCEPVYESLHWRSSGHLHYRLYAGVGGQLGRLIVGNAIQVLVLAGLFFHFDERLTEFLRNTLEMRAVTREQIAGWFWMLIAGLVFLDVFQARMALRIDTDSKTVSVFRFLGIWRSDYSFVRFDGFLLSPPAKAGRKADLFFNIAGLSSPLLLVGDASPDRLRSALCETAALLGVDPWESLATHPKEYVPANEVEKSAPEWLVKAAARVRPYAERVRDCAVDAARRLDAWTKRKWPD